MFPSYLVCCRASLQHSGFSSGCLLYRIHDRQTFALAPLRRHSRAVPIHEVIQTINRVQADGVIERYAIGGAVGATFYLEPVSTLDVDIFVAFTGTKEQLVSLEPIFNDLKRRGCKMEGGHIVIADWPVQFLPADAPLLEEALREAATIDVDEVPARVFTAEHLAAIALQTGRSKDKARLLQFIEARALNSEKFEAIIRRHGLSAKWERFQKQFHANISQAPD
jgi:hypothetical protein